MGYCPISCESTGGAGRCWPAAIITVAAIASDDYRISFCPLIFEEVEALSPKDRMIDFVIQAPMRERFQGLVASWT